MYGNHFKFNGGALLITEAGYMPKSEGDGNLNKFAVGAWTYTKKFDDLVDVDASGNPVKRRSSGVYLLSSYELYHDKDAGQSVTAFLRPGISDGDTQPTEWAYETGVVGHGFVPSRSDSEIGLGFAQSHNSEKFIRSVIAAGNGIEHNEYGLELYYRDKLYHGIAIQPDLQYVINPGTNPQVDNATVIGVRLDINL